MSHGPAHEISTETVRLIRDYTGRGPTQARTTIGDDLVAVIVGDTLTPAERTLVEHGHSVMVRSTRHAFQEAMGADLIAVVERHTERKVVAFMSTNHVDPDIGVELFVLAPARAS